MKIHSPLALLAFAAILHAQAPPPVNPFSPGQRPMSPEEIEASLPRSLSICYETFSIPLALAAKFQREDKSDAEIYAVLGVGQEKDGIRLESFDVMSSGSSQKSLTEAISERIYPTEFKPPSIPSTVGVAVSTPPTAPEAAKLERARTFGKFESLRAPALVTAMDTRNTGRILQCEPVLVNDSIASLRIIPEQVTYVGRSSWGQGISTAQMPTFETQRITTEIYARTGQPILLGTISRPPVSAVDSGSAQRVWFAFVTMTVVKP